jgi:Tol biopolymer transport system component
MRWKAISLFALIILTLGIKEQSLSMTDLRMERIVEKWEKGYLTGKWSPDGRFLFFIRVEKTNEIPACGSLFKVDIRTKKCEPVLKSKIYESVYFIDMAFSFDGKYLALEGVDRKSKRLQLWLLNLKNGEMELLEKEGPDFDFDWSPKENKIAYSVGFRIPESTLYIYDVNKREKRLVMKGAAFPRFSPNGDWLIFHTYEITKWQTDKESGAKIPIEGRFALNVLDLKTFKKEDLLPNFDVAYFLWSPDSRQIALSVSFTEEVREHLYLLDLGHRHIEKLIENVAEFGFSSNSQYIACSVFGPPTTQRREELSYDIYIIDLKTKGMRKLTSNGSSWFIEFNPKLPNLFVYRDDSKYFEKGPSFHLRYLDTNLDIPLTPQGSKVNYLVWCTWSPDGRYLAYIGKGEEIWLAGPLF